ncbi:MAG TPA: DUF2917 domain-containing protein [Burkholderiales bacterium]|nr:DUF2917 domain-containing protein [Burkholderiales bacterium]
MERKLWTEPFDARIVVEGMQLSRNDVVGIRDGRRALVFVESGTVWITQENDVRDVLVPAGGSFRLDRDGLALVQAHRSATITVTAPLGDDGPEAFRVAPAPARRRGHPLVRRMWAIVLRMYRRHARPRPWEIRMEPERATPLLRLVDPVGPGRRIARDPAAELRAAAALDITRCA